MNFHDLIPLSRKHAQLMTALQGSNAISVRYGLTLSRADMQILWEKQTDALRNTGRVEFGHGPYEKLIYAFCDSPYLAQADYAETLAALCTMFYQFKSKFGEQWSDDELIDSMKRLYDGECHGSLDLVGDRLWQARHPHPDDEDIVNQL